MTATTLPAAPTADAATRTWNVVRMHVANPWSTLIVPWLIMLVIFGLTLAIWLMGVNAVGGVENLEPGAFQYNGGVSWIVIFMMVTAVQAMNYTFRFALGFSATRRDFYLGSVLYFALLALLYSTGLTAMAALERATDGWGVDGAFFAPFGLVDEPLLTVWFLYLTAMLLFFFLGAAIATVWVRWHAYGLYAFFAGLAVLVVGSLWAVTATDSWPDVWSFLTSTSLVALAAWTLPATALCGVVGYLFLRKATPRA